MSNEPASELLKSKARCSLLAGALGDAIGGVVEFMRLDEIQKSFGPSGISQPEFSEAYGRKGAITDDTQMALFTAEGLIRAWVRGNERGIGHPPSVIHHAYIRWLKTQGVDSPAMRGNHPDGWLWGVQELHQRRAPGATCLTALESARHFGETAKNDSKGCGAVMRAAPIGIFAYANQLGAAHAFELGVETGKLTHGHPSGYFSSGALAVIIAELMAERTLPESIETALNYLDQHPSADETADAIRQAMEAAASPKDHNRAIKELGEGWVGEEALAIGIYCALKSQQLAEGILMAANHDGDSDSTASIAGNLLGCVFAENDLPADWLQVLELREVIVQVAEDLVNFGLTQESDPNRWRDRYPGW